MFTLYFHDTAGVRWLCDADDDLRAHALARLWSHHQHQEVTIIRNTVEIGGSRFVAIYNAGQQVSGRSPVLEDAPIQPRVEH
jgi:hypothetical protein